VGTVDGTYSGQCAAQSFVPTSTKIAAHVRIAQRGPLGMQAEERPAWQTERAIGGNHGSAAPAPIRTLLRVVTQLFALSRREMNETKDNCVRDLPSSEPVDNPSR
jgi:hypothetical protein